MGINELIARGIADKCIHLHKGGECHILDTVIYVGLEDCHICNYKQACKEIVPGRGKEQTLTRRL